MTIPYDLQADQIKTGLDYVRETEAEIAKLGPARGKPAEHLNVATDLSLQMGLDDPEILHREIGILKALGFNQTYQLIAPPEQAVEFYKQNGLLPRLAVGCRSGTTFSTARSTTRSARPCESTSISSPIRTGPSSTSSFAAN